MRPATTVDEIAAERRAALVTLLAEERGLSCPRLRAAFARVPRHAFVADHAFWLPERPDDRFRWPEMPDPAEAIAAAYTDRPLVVRCADDGGIRSSCTAPSLVGHLLQELDPPTGARVLEIGTGTGYAAALLSEVTGAAVETVEIDHGLAAVAGRTLARLGFDAVTVRAGDATRLDSGYACFSRVLVSAATTVVPGGWIAALRPGGTLVATYPLPWRGLTLVVRRTGEDMATGRFLANGGRTCPSLVHGGSSGATALPGVPVHEAVEVSLDEFGPAGSIEPGTPAGLALLAGFAIPGLAALPFSPPAGGAPAVQLVDGHRENCSLIVDGSGAVRATSAGRGLAERLTAVRRLWDGAGRPDEGGYVWSWQAGRTSLATRGGRVLGERGFLGT
ncbi:MULTISPECIES: protein-L-isoaspartate O-methyltransferase family protein [Streptosporangium]|uniref:Protein-L-isoaspartate O-methyltransferase n=1 Tax=Streptosporangium brasiliense TaxID=47480 RepID=A0ABT9RB49_9ACTN|nr:methyltransferase domain-containing protein [Streptosporangium brasiliense]MDP9866487.1 protein-L-isoaspartate O-methyltransferase [Streptosporangium brasiliense]